MLSFIDADHSLRALDDWTCQLLDHFVNRGYTPAQFRKSEILLLHKMIRLWNTRASSLRCGTQHELNAETVRQPQEQLRGNLGDIMQPESELGAMYDLSPGQILSLAEMVGVEESHLQDDTGWIDEWLWDQPAECMQ